MLNILVPRAARIRFIKSINIFTRRKFIWGALSITRGKLEAHLDIDTTDFFNISTSKIAIFYLKETKSEKMYKRRFLVEGYSDFSSFIYLS